MGRVLATILVAVLCTSVRAGPIQVSESCSRTCTGTNKFNFVSGQTYLYQYDSDVKTLVQGASDDHASLHMSATVQLQVLSKCELAMQLKDVALTEHDPVDNAMKEVSSEFKAGLEKYPLRLSYQDGGVEELCLAGEEPTWVLNVKRGLISLIQNNMDNFQTNHTVSETDVSGVCDTEYYTKDSGRYTVSVSKTKNLLGCTDRHAYNTAIQGVPYTSESEIQSLPLLKSDHNCVHDIDTRSKILKSVKCEERHVFRPFSKSDSGAVTINSQTLMFVRATTGTRSPAPIITRASLKFDHILDPAGGDKSRKDITRKLLEICEKTKSGVRPETPRLFTDLVYMMKSADADLISDMYKMLSEEKICSDNIYRTRKFFLDALPVAGSSATLHLMTELITSQVITGIEADMWLTSLAFIKNPTRDMLREVKPLINMADNNEKAMLSVGTLVHSYCYHHGNCEDDDMVKAIVSAFVNKMVKGCKVSGEDMKTTLMALRGLGNAGYATSAIPQLEVCMQLSSNPIEIRLSAIEAFRRMPCESDRAALMGILQNVEEDSEIRIAAYKVLMECPTDKVLTLVRNTLANEQVNQVGSYIWTHLTNLMETSDRHKQGISDLLNDETFKKEFDLDQRKFSRNYEKSIFIERLNTGAKVEGDVIWSSKSFIPRSAMMNLTFDFVGHSVNLFEIGGRAEGLEYFLESFFGPNGYFSKPEEAASTSDVIPKGIREDKIKKIDKRFSAQMAELRGSMYMRVFGNELRYMNFIGMNDLLLGANMNILDTLLKLADDNDYTYSHSGMFLDSSFIVPTSSGFPLNLTVNGTATVDLRMKGKMDFKNMDISGIIQPSAAIDVSSMMSVDAFVTKSGIKMVSTLHTSTSVQGKLMVDKDGSLSVEYENPEPRMEIIDVKSSFFTIHRDTEREQKMITDNRQSVTYCSPKRLVTITGLELCAEVNYPNASIKSDAPYFPMTGPISAGVYLYNRDTHIKYRMEARSVHNKDSNIVRLAFDTPGSRIDRHVEVDFNLNKKDLSVDATLTSPWKKANLQGAVALDKNNYGLTGKMNVDGTSPHSFKALLNRDESGDSFVYSPSLEIMTPNREPIIFKAMISNKKWNQIDVHYEMSGVLKSLVTAKATIHNKPVLMGIEGSVEVAKNKQYSLDMTVSSKQYKKKTIYKPLVSIRSPTEEMLAFGGDVTINFDKGVDVNLILDKIVEKKVTLKGMVMQVDKRRRMLYSTKIDFTSSPADFSLKAKLDNRAFRTIATDVEFTYVIRRVARDKLQLVSKITNLSSSSLTKAKASMNFESSKYPDVNFKLMSNIDHNKKHTEIDSDLWYGKDFKNDDKHVELRFEMNRKFKSLMEAEGDIQTRFRFPELDLSVMMKGAHSHDGRNLMSNLTARFGKGQPFETSIRVQDKTEKLMKIETEYSLSFDGLDLDIDHTLEQTDLNMYLSSLKTQTKKDQTNTIISQIRTNNGRYGINSEIKLYKKNPAHLEGEFSWDPSDFVTSLSYEKDSKRYSGSLTSATEVGKSSWMTLDLSHPERHFILALSSRKVNEVFFGDANLQLSETEKFSVNSWCETPTNDKVNGSISVSYPSRTVTLNAYHTQGSKYSTHLDLQWDPKKKLSATTNIDVIDDQLIANAIISTPFDAFPQAKMDVVHKHDSEEYNTQSQLSWGVDGVLDIQSIIKKPVSLKTLVGSLDVKSSIEVIRKVNIDVNHKLSSSLASNVKISVNRNFVDATIALQNTTKGRKLGFQGNLDLKTSFQYMKKGTIEMSHTNDGRMFMTDLSFQRNRKQYTIKSQVTHQPSETRYDNSGLVTIATPDGNFENTWTHTHSSTNIATWLKSTWGKDNAVTARLSSTFDGSFSTVVDFQSPFDMAKDAKFEVSYVRDSKALESKAILTVNGRKLGSAEIGYTSRDENKAKLTLIIPDLQVDSKLEADLSSPDNDEIAAHINAIITPELSMSLEGTQKFSHTMIMWKSSFPGYEQIRYSYDIFAQDSITTVTQLQYGQDKTIRLETKKLLVDFFDRKEDMDMSAILTTPFDKLPKMQIGVSFKGNLDSFTSNAFLEIQPLFDKASAAFSWNTRSGLISNLRIDLPIPEYPFFQADVNGTFNSGSSNVLLKVEYIPGQIVQYEMNHSVTETDFALSAKGSSPYGTLSVTHNGKPRDFKCNAAFQTTDGKKYGIDATFSSKRNIEGSMTIATYGRRDISASFNHSGNALKFNTHAEIRHNRKNSFDSDLNFELGKMLTLGVSASFKTQFLSETEEYAAKYNINGILAKFSTHGEFSTTSLGKSEADFTLDLTNDKEGSLTIKSPLVRNIKASFNHFIKDGYMQSKAIVVHGGQNILDAQTTLNTNGAKVMEASLKTPLHKDIAFMTRFDGKLESFVVRAEGSYGENKADLDLSSQYGDKLVSQRIGVRATNMNDISGEISFMGDLTQMKLFGELNIGQDRHRIDATFSNIRSIDASLSLESPLTRPLSAKIQIHNLVKDFRCHAEINAGSEKGELDFSFGTRGTFNLGVNLKNPFFKSVSANLKHVGTMPNLDTTATITVDGTGDFNIKLFSSVKDTTSASLTISTPFEDFTNFETAFNLKLNGPKSLHFEYTLKDKKSELDASFDNDRKYAGKISVKSHLIPDSSISFEHYGHITNFRSHGEFSYGTDKRESDINVNLEDKVDISIEYKCPEHGTSRLAYTHTGGLNDFKCHTEVTLMEEKWEGDLTFNSKDNIHVLLDLTPAPASGLNKQTLTFNYIKNDLAMKVSGSYNDDITASLNLSASVQETSLDASFIKDFDEYKVTYRHSLKDKISIDGKFISPIEGYKSVQVTYQHDGSSRNFQCNGTLTKENDISMMKLKLDTRNLENVKGNFDIVSPYISPISFKIAHSNSSGSYRDVVELNVAGKKLYSLVVFKTDQNGKIELVFNGTKHTVIDITRASSTFKLTSEIIFSTGSSKLVMTFSSDPKLTGTFSLMTPFTPTVVANMDFSGSLSDFAGSSDIMVDGKKNGRAVFSWKSKEKLSATFSLELPITDYSELSGEFNFIPGDRTFKMDAKLSSEFQKLFDVTLDLDAKEKIFVNFALESTKPHPLAAKWYFSFAQNKLITTMDLSHNSQQIVSGSVDLTTGFKPFLIDGTISITSKNLDNSLSILVNPADKIFETSGTFTLADKSWSLMANYKGKSDISSDFKLSIPDWDEIRGSFVHKSSADQMKTDAEFRYNTTHALTYNMILKWTNGLDGTISLLTPFKGFETTKLKINHEGSFQIMKSTGELLFANKKISGLSTISKNDLTTAMFSLRTPFEGLEDLALSMYHEGYLSNFKTGGKLGYANGKDIQFDIQHSLTGMTLKSMVRLMSPFTDEIIVSANHSGGPSDFSNVFKVSVGSGIQYSSKTSMKTDFQFVRFTNDISSTLSGETFQQRIELKHDGSPSKFKTEAKLESLGYVYQLDASFQLDPVIEGSFGLKTPFQNFTDIKASFSHSGSSSSILTTGELQYALKKKISGRFDLNQYGWRRMTTTIELQTPFEGMGLNKITYKHSGDSNKFHCEMDSSVIGRKVTGTIAASRSPYSINLDLKTPFTGFETIVFNGNIVSNRHQYSGKVQAKWNPQREVIVDASLSTDRPIDGSIAISTPFEQLSEGSIKFSETFLAKGSVESLKITMNSQAIVDADLEHSLSSEHKHVVLTVRAPQPMKYEVDGDFTVSFVDFDLTADWNSSNADSKLKLETGYDIRSDKTVNFKVTQSKLPGKVIAITAMLNSKSSKADLTWGMKPNEKLGYEIRIGDFDGSLKLVLPDRSIEFSGNQRGRVSEGSFFWDADVDRSRQVTVKTVWVPASDVNKADVTIVMPSLGKNIKVSSQIALNQGRVIFDGKTEVAYSGDSRKNIVIISKLENIAPTGSHNYSFIFGVSHPYSTIGINLKSHISRSELGYSASLGLDYLTVKQETVKLQIGGSIDKLRKSLSFELQSPIKLISISGSVQTNEQFRLSLLNSYDQKAPLSTVLTVDAKTRLIEVVHNYDLDNPRNELHVSARYVNSSAIAAEVYRVTDSARLSDIVFTVRLNNSHLLHSRLHWRPEIMKDLQAYRAIKMADYRRRLHVAAQKIEPEIIEEVIEKFRRVWTAVGEEIGKENLARFEAAVVPMFDYGMQTIVSVSQPMIQQLNEYLATSRDYSDLILNGRLDNMITFMKIKDNQAELLPSLRQMVSQNVNFLSDKMKIPTNGLLGYMTSTPVPNMLNAGYAQAVLNSITDNGLTLNGAVVSFLRGEIQRLEKAAETILRDAEKIILAHLKNPFTVYDPEHGEIQMELYSVIPLQSLDSLPVLDLVKYVKKIENMKKQASRSIEAVKLPDFSGEWVPPFTGIASVSKGHKITTFDGYIYDLENTCTYMLSRDYTDGNFSLILSNDGYTTLTILTSGKPISISINGDILLAGEPATLPFTEGFVTVSRNADDSININGGDHFNINYDLTIDHMTIQVSGWYHGKTGGLLGVYDNEPSNDLMTSFNKVIDNSDRFARTWDVSTSTCR